MYVLILGGVIMDQYVLVDRFPQRGMDTLIHQSFEQVGGCAINVASTIHNLGGTPLIVSQVGDDQRGKTILRYLKEKGFSLEAIQVVRNQKTGYCLTIVENSGERTFLTEKGCESGFRTELVSKDWIEKISSLYLTGYYLLDPPYDVEIVQFIQRLKERSITILFDPGPLVDQINPRILRSMVQLADIITPNQEELEKIKRLLGIQSSVYKWLLNNGVKWVIEKKGSQGIDVWISQGEKRSFPAYPVRSVDTSGAGDSFAGGLLFGLNQYGDFEKAIDIARACGALTTTFLSPHGSFTFQDILKVIGE